MPRARGAEGGKRAGLLPLPALRSWLYGEPHAIFFCSYRLKSGIGPNGPRAPLSGAESSRVLEAPSAKHGGV